MAIFLPAEFGGFGVGSNLSYQEECLFSGYACGQ